MAGSAVGVAVPGSSWTVNHLPAANTTATCTKGAPAGAAQKLVVTTITATVRAGAATAIGTSVSLTDGGSNVLWTSQIGVDAVIGRTFTIPEDGEWVCAPGQNVTLAFAAGPGASNFESVSMSGYVIE